MSNGGISPLFLTQGQVMAYHHQQIELFGGGFLREHQVEIQ